MQGPMKERTAAEQGSEIITHQNKQNTYRSRGKAELHAHNQENDPFGIDLESNLANVIISICWHQSSMYRT